MIASSVQLRADAQLTTPDEYVNRLSYLHPTPTTDTTPMKIRVGSVVYEIPRNYIKSAVELMPTLWITYPQFQPPTSQTRCSSKNQLPAYLISYVPDFDRRVRALIAPFKNERVNQ